MGHPEVVPVVVVGCGPTGIACLHHARACGIRAVGLEARAAPLAAIRAYPERLLLVSRPHEYEIPGLPLDCRQPHVLTRDDVLRYYARVIECGRLDVRRNTECLALTPLNNGEVEVTTSAGPDHRLRARHVIITAWHESRSIAMTAGATPVMYGFSDASALAGRRCVVVGGGRSAIEHATALMLCGQTVAIVARGLLGSRPPRFSRLIDVTASTVVERAEDLRVTSRGVEYRTGGIDRVLPCDVAIACIGSQVRRGVLEMLIDAGVMPRALADALAVAPTADDLVRNRPDVPAPKLINLALSLRPDLWDYVFHGRHGVRFAGGILHVGGAHAGMLLSLYSARLVVQLIAGCAPPAYLQPPLPVALRRFARQNYEWDRASFDCVAGVRPLAIGVSPQSPTPALPSSSDVVDEQLARTIVERSDGQRTVAQLAEDTGIEYAELVGICRKLWAANVLSWLPPIPQEEAAGAS
jgi:thioredoxin reductase